MKNVVVIGASNKIWRYSYKAVISLKRNGYNPIPIGNYQGNIDSVPILTKTRKYKDVYAVLLYINSEKQKIYYNYIISLKPDRLIFNPGTENDELYRIAIDNGINVLYDCSLILLATGNF